MTDSTQTIFEQPTLRASSIRPSKSQPRKYFDQRELDDMAASIRSVGGLIQPITVRKTEDNNIFELIAGERRWRGMQMVFGADCYIPVVFKDVDDRMSEIMGMIENIQRSNMNPAEEAQGATKVLGLCAGDRNEAARVLGWSRAMIDKRLALMNCSDIVRDNLIHRKIDLGHAELLAAVPKEQQDKVLGSMFGLPQLPTVSQLKAMLEAIAQPLEQAIFDRHECLACHHNSGNQQSLFSEAISNGNCTNSNCYGAKTEAALQVKAESLKGEWQTIRIMRAGEDELYTKLMADGPTGVGNEQALACRACANYGVGISAIPGSVGSVQNGSCFDMECNQRKVVARIKAEKQVAGDHAHSKSENPSEGKPRKTKSGTEASVQISQRLKDYREKTWRNVFLSELSESTSRNLSVLIALALTGNSRHVESTPIKEVLFKHGIEDTQYGDVGATAAVIHGADSAVRQELLYALAPSVANGLEISHIVAVLNFCNADLAKHWKLNSEYLDILTKSEIEVVAEDLGIKASLGDSFKKLIGGKKDDLVKGLLSVSGFAYEGAVPNSMLWPSAPAV